MPNKCTGSSERTQEARQTRPDQLCKGSEKRNHFMSQCLSYLRKKKAAIHSVIRDVDIQSRRICSVTLTDSRIFSVHGLVKKAVSHSTAIFATMFLDQPPIWFQIDCGASYNIIPSALVSSNIRLEKHIQVLVIYNEIILRPAQTVNKNPMKQEMLLLGVYSSSYTGVPPTAG